MKTYKKLMYLCPKLERKGMVCDMSAVEGNQAFMDQLQAEMPGNVVLSAAKQEYCAEGSSSCDESD